MKVIDTIRGPIVVVLAGYDAASRSGEREYYGLGFIELGRPQRFSDERDVERADRFYDDVFGAIGGHPHYKPLEGYRYLIRFEKLYSSSEISRFRTSWGTDRRTYHVPYRPNEGCVLFLSAERFRREYPEVFREILWREAGITFKSSLRPQNA